MHRLDQQNGEIAREAAVGLGVLVLFPTLVYFQPMQIDLKVCMSREPILQGNQAADDDRDLRPQHMTEMVGQREVFERIEIAVDATRKREEPLGHILFDGPPGLG